MILEGSLCTFYNRNNQILDKRLRTLKRCEMPYCLCVQVNIDIV